MTVLSTTSVGIAGEAAEPTRTPLSASEFADVCRYIVASRKGHAAHLALDAVVTNLLTNLGYGEGMAIFLEAVTPVHAPHQDCAPLITEARSLAGEARAEISQAAIGPIARPLVTRLAAMLDKTARRLDACTMSGERLREAYSAHLADFDRSPRLTSDVEVEWMARAYHEVTARNWAKAWFDLPVQSREARKGTMRAAITKACSALDGARLSATKANSGPNT